MRAFILATLFGVGALLLAGEAEAQYRYVDAKGISKVTQYKADIPEAQRDAAVWVGPTGIGKPALSTDAKAAAAREETYRRSGIAQAEAIRGGTANEAQGNETKRNRDYRTKKAEGRDHPMAEMCIAKEDRVMVSPGHWEVRGTCTPTH
jgi:hypothetical protein